MTSFLSSGGQRHLVQLFLWSSSGHWLLMSYESIKLELFWMIITHFTIKSKREQTVKIKIKSNYGSSLLTWQSQNCLWLLWVKSCTASLEIFWLMFYYNVFILYNALDDFSGINIEIIVCISLRQLDNTATLQNCYWRKGSHRHLLK